MNINYKLIVALVAGVAIGGAFVQGLHAQAKPPAIVVIDISKITNPEAFKAVGGRPNATGAAAAKEYGGHYIARTENITALTGTAPKRFIIITFDSAEKAHAFYNSPYMKNVNATREKSTKSRVFIVEGLPQ